MDDELLRRIYGIQRCANANPDSEKLKDYSMFTFASFLAMNKDLDYTDLTCDQTGYLVLVEQIGSIFYSIIFMDNKVRILSTKDGTVVCQDYDKPFTLRKHCENNS